MNWYKTYSNSKPDEVDFLSSPTTVYMRRSIHQLEDGSYEYEECKLSKEDYLKYGNLFLLQQQAELLNKYREIEDKETLNNSNNE